MPTGWPAVLAEGAVGLRPLRLRDQAAWHEIRARNHAWLAPWEATTPPSGAVAASSAPPSFATMVWRFRAEARAGLSLPFAITFEGKLVGQLTVGGIAYGAARSGFIGYWIDQRVAGRGVTPTAVALAIDHCFGVLRLHRIEICIRPENAASRRVVEKLGLRYEGIRPRFLHIAGAWCDHMVFAVTIDEVPDGILPKWRGTQARTTTDDTRKDA